MIDQLKIFVPSLLPIKTNTPTHKITIGRSSRNILLELSLDKPQYSIIPLFFCGQQIIQPPQNKHANTTQMNRWFSKSINTNLPNPVRITAMTSNILVLFSIYKLRFFLFYSTQLQCILRLLFTFHRLIQSQTPSSRARHFKLYTVLAKQLIF